MVKRLELDINGKPTAVSPTEVWIAARRRDGRYKEFIDRTKARMKSEGLPWKHASHKTMVEMGYTPGKAISEYRQWVKKQMEEREIEQREIEAARRARLGEDAEMLTAYAALPSEAPQLPADVAWVYNHNLMNPAVSMPMKDGRPNIKAQDMAGAPSRGAVGMLVHYANAKTEFYKLVLSHFSRKDVKAEAELGGKEVESADDFSELEQLAKAFIK